MGTMFGIRIIKVKAIVSFYTKNCQSPLNNSILKAFIVTILNYLFAGFADANLL